MKVFQHLTKLYEEPLKLSVSVTFDFGVIDIQLELSWNKRISGENKEK